MVSPLKLTAWMQYLQSYPDPHLKSFILRGLEHGFRIGVKEGFRLHRAPRNLASAFEQPQVVQTYLDRELSLRRVLFVPPQSSSSPLIQISPFGVIPKKQKPNKWRLIVDLSSPRGRSVNDAIPKELCSIAYTSLDDAVALIQAAGSGCLLAKADLQEAYRAVPVHPSDQRLLAVRWKGSTFVDRVLPFGLRSAPKIFSAIIDAMMWILHERGVKRALHYLDDFLIVGRPNSRECHIALATTLSICEALGFPVAPDKTEGPTTSLVFLGIEIDTVASQLRLPQDKLTALLSTISQWMVSRGRLAPRASGKKRALLSLIGRLNYAAMVVRPGRAFLRSLIDAASTARELDHWVHLNAIARSDLAWWYTFLQAWNGVSLLPSQAPSIFITSDASGNWGCGALHGNAWFQLEWPQSWAEVSIAPKELVPIIVAVGLWGVQWSGSTICCLCDNAAVVATINKGSARDPSLVRLLRILAWFSAMLNLSMRAQHLPGTQNISADALSRGNLPLFFAHNPQASPIPAIIPRELGELALNRSLLWTSPSWTGLFSTTLTAALRLPLARPISQPNGATALSVPGLESGNHIP